MQFREVTILIVAETLLSLVLFTAVIGILVFLVRKRIRKYKPADLAVFDRLQRWVSPANNRAMLFFSFLGSHKFLIPANLLLIFFFLFSLHQSWFSIRVITIALSSLVLMFLLKYLFQRKRPLSPLLKAARGLSFPSGHAIISVTFYGLLLHISWNLLETGLLRWAIAVLLITIILFIGYSRIYLRVHYASDVISGFIIGLLWLLISLWVLDNLEQYAKTIV
ncbi:MAG: phosphatase PAP2 family protein [Bacteroidetes bacterium]|nr:MAG: phosphatase PAP2 family protein [Bacteroidota bacterium]